MKGRNLLIGTILVVILIIISDNFGFWLMIGLLAAAGLTLLYSLIHQLHGAFAKSSSRRYSKDFSLKILATVMGLMLTAGTLFYIYVFYQISIQPDPLDPAKHQMEITNAEYLFRSLICSLDLFMLDVDSNILDRLDNAKGLKGTLTVLAIISFSCTVAMLISLVYSRLHAYYRLHYSAKITPEKNHLYLFFGDNAPSEILIGEIMREDQHAVAVIIDEANLKDDDSDEWEGIVGLVTHNQKIFRKAEKIGAHVAIAGKQLDLLNEEMHDREEYDAFAHLGLSRIKKLIGKLADIPGAQLHIFFMGDDEELNMRNISALAKDITIKAIADAENVTHRIYCHARYNGPNRVIEDVAVKRKLHLKIIDSSHMAVELLKLDSECHPVHVVSFDKDKPATVNSTLTALIIGFGEVGRDAFRFLYEFGAFPDSADPNVRSKFDCTIVDSNLDNIKGSFMASMPGVFDPAHKEAQVNVRFVESDFHSQEFNSGLLTENFLREVNYIVISIGNNDEAIALAARLFNRIRKVREDLWDLRIFVRCTDDRKTEGIRKIADHYNYGYGDGLKNPAVIRIFGEPAKTYTYRLTVSDRLIEVGKEYHKKYNLYNNEKETWEERHARFTSSPVPQIESLRTLRRKESQDCANALHARTKLHILQSAMQSISGDGFDWNELYRRYFNSNNSANCSGRGSEIRYIALSDRENELILHIAMLEHLRWNAAHQLLGYVFNHDGSDCDERTMKHNCLCRWDGLEAQSKKQTGWDCDYQKFDFCVVDTTLALHKEDKI